MYFLQHQEPQTKKKHQGLRPLNVQPGYIHPLMEAEKAISQIPKRSLFLSRTHL